MDKERKENLLCYLKIFGGIMLIFPICHAFLALDLGLMNGGLITAILFLMLMIIAIPLFNYLQYGKFRFNITTRHGKTK